MCQVQGGIITDQQSLTLPKELADSIAAASDTATDTSKNGTRTARVIYTAPYSNVRISSKEPKSLKYLSIPAVISKKHIPSPTVIVPVLRTSSTTTPEPTTTATTTTTTTSTSTTTSPPPPSSTFAAPVQEVMPDIIEILEMEEIEPSNEDEGLVTEATGSTSGDLTFPSSEEFEKVAVTEPNFEENE